jgi:signal transduction histidine kinase
MQEGDLRRCYVDLTLIHQIVTNLLSNALKFSAAGSLVQLNVRGTDDTLELVVTDAGIGIPESDLEHIFEPFFRASNIGEVRGTGLGMAIVRDCVDIQEGTLDVKSVKGEGTTVTIRLPRQPLPDDVTLPSVSGG